MNCKKKDLIEAKIIIGLLSIKYVMVFIIISFFGWDMFLQELKERSNIVTVSYLLFVLTPLLLFIVYKLIFKKYKNDKHKKFNN
jgi:hypothetical protein|tara:strand:- start:314 stop:565 length:252 start_codon:yes stop_codon:yes gene_type:complete